MESQYTQVCIFSCTHERAIVVNHIQQPSHKRHQKKTKKSKTSPTGNCMRGEGEPEERKTIKADSSDNHKAQKKVRNIHFFKRFLLQSQQTSMKTAQQTKNAMTKEIKSPVLVVHFDQLLQLQLFDLLLYHYHLQQSLPYPVKCKILDQRFNCFRFHGFKDFARSV